MPPTASNLCLHYLQSPGARPRRLALDAEKLRAIVARERGAHRSSASLADYVGDVPPAADRFTLSFDDAHHSVLGLAAPLLAELGVPGTLFVPTAYVGTSDEFLDWDGLRALRDAGWTLGSHTATHARMSWRQYDETPERYAARLYEDCARSRAVLERALGIEIALFAYPYGECPPEAREAVRRAGYTAAFTVAEAVEWDGDRLRIPRADAMEAHGIVRASSDFPDGFSVVVPACDRVEILREVVGRLAAQSYPRERHEVIVADDGSRTDLREALREFGTAVRVLPGGERGVFGAGGARQRGADAARFDTVAFLDADVAVGRDFLWHLDWVHRRVPRAVVLGYLSGYNLHDMGWTHSLASVREVRDLERDLAVIPDRSREPALRACLDNVDWLDEPWRLAYTGNLSLPRALLNEAGGFSREFSGWGLEDLDLGLRLERANANWVFSRFAVGFHIVDADEGPPRNPFRVENPRREHFDGYLRNLATLARLHATDGRVRAFREQSLHDVDETCSRPDTVGVEMGGACSLDCRFHRMINRCQPGGATVAEVLDRVAYARKVGARALYVLGGEPGEHPALLPLLEAARAAGIRRVAVQTNATPFDDRALALAAARAGMTSAVVKVFGFDAARYDAITRTAGAYDRFVRGLSNLRDAGVALSALLVVTRETVESLGTTLDELEKRGVPVAEVVAIGEETAAVVEPVIALTFARAGRTSPPVRTAI